jgi:hypothetical protein
MIEEENSDNKENSENSESENDTLKTPVKSKRYYELTQDSVSKELTKKVSLKMCVN